MNMPWIGVQHWETPTFLHWPVPYQTLRALVPQPFQIDTFNEQAWVGVVPFKAVATYPRWGSKIFSLGPLWQLNIRTYVRFGDKRGVYFLKIYTNSKTSLLGARALLSLPYYYANFNSFTSKSEISCTMTPPNHHGKAQFSMTIKPSSASYYPDKQSLAYWLTERYHLFGIKGKRIVQSSIVHAPWLLQEADYKIQHRHLSHLIPEDKHPLVHVAASQTTRLYPFKVKGIYLN